MKVYKVFFNNDYDTWTHLNNCCIHLPHYKNKIYNKRNESNQLFQIQINNKVPCINTFCEDKIENSLFFFLDLFDAIKYTSYSSNKFGNFNNVISEYKILELEIPNELILKYLGIGNYEFEKEFTYNLAIEVTIPFDELQKLEQCTIYDTETIQLNNAKIYDENADNIQKILEYLQENPNYKSQNYMQMIEQILQVLNFQIIFGTLYKNQDSGKSNVRHYKTFLLNEFLVKISKEIEENMNKANDYNFGKKVN